MVQRIVGLASGMDIDSMVKKLMNAEKVPLDKLKQKKQVLEWQRDDYRTLNAAFFDFRTTLTNMKLTSQYRVRSTVSSNDSAVTATASSGAGLSSYTLKNISQLATAATKVNNNAISDPSKGQIDPSAALYNQVDKLNLNSGSSLSWKSGSIETQTYSSDGSTPISLNLNGSKLITTTTKDSSGKPTNVLDSINVKVNGVGYIAVTGKTQSQLADNEVNIDSSGNLTFKTAPSAGTSIQVDYVTDGRIETISKDSKEFQLSKTNISNLVITDGANTYTLDDPTKSNPNLVGTDSNGNPVTIGSVDLTTGKITFASDFTPSGDMQAKSQELYSTFNIQTYTSKSKNAINENFIFKSTDSLNTVMNRVNNSSVGINMMYDSFSDKITMTRTETGNFHNPPESSTYDPAQDSSDIMLGGDLLNIIYNPSNTVDNDGKNAKFEINGLTTYRNSNTFEMNGVTFTLKQITDSTTPVTVTVKNDSDKVFDNIKAMVDQYNKLIDQVQGKLNEERDRDYTPLTDDQREQLSDKQQEQWEAKAKSGLLRGDTTLSSALTQMRSSFYQSVQNPNVAAAFNQLASIGITTSADYTQGGKLEIDEAKLKKAIETDPTSVENLFRGTGDTTASKGIAQRLFDNVTNTINALNDKAGKSYSTNKQFAIGRSLDDVNNQITAFTDKLSKIEDRYYAQFTAMEQAIQKNNQQASYLQQYFGGGQ